MQILNMDCLQFVSFMFKHRRMNHNNHAGPKHLLNDYFCERNCLWYSITCYKSSWRGERVFRSTRNLQCMDMLDQHAWKSINSTSSETLTKKFTSFAAKNSIKMEWYTDWPLITFHKEMFLPFQWSREGSVT